MKKVLIILNPCAGKMQAKKYLADIINTFTVNDYMSTVLTTTKRGDGITYAKDYAKDYDLIVAIGGDGTFNEVVDGMILSETKIPIGYIPAGSTNDFAASLNLSTNIKKAAVNIATGEPVPFDVGKFNGRCFTYVACFGAFTKASYNTPQNVKNAIGHIAYILSGINSLASVQKEHVRIVVDEGTDKERILDDEYIFGSITNATSFGGVLKYKPEMVDMADGEFEMLLVKVPKDAIEVGEILTCATNQNFSESSLFEFVTGSNFKITSYGKTDWSLDGEYQPGVEEIEVNNLHHAIHLMMK